MPSCSSLWAPSGCWFLGLCMCCLAIALVCRADIMPSFLSGTSSPYFCISIMILLKINVIWMLHVQIANVFVCMLSTWFLHVFCNFEYAGSFWTDDFGFFLPVYQLHLVGVAPLGPLNLSSGDSLYAVGWWLMIGDNISLGFPFLYFSCFCNVFGAAGVQQN